MIAKRVQIFCNFSEENENKCRLVVLAQLEFTQSNWFQSQISTEVWSGLENFCQALERQVIIESDSSECLVTRESFSDIGQVQNTDSSARPSQQQIVPLILPPITRNTEPIIYGFEKEDLMIVLSCSVLLLTIFLKGMMEQTYSNSN